MEKIKLSQLPDSVQSEYEAITSGAGWVTFEYLQNFVELPEDEFKQLALYLQQEGMLYDEDKLTDPESDEPNWEAKMTIDEVLNLF